MTRAKFKHVCGDVAAFKPSRAMGGIAPWGVFLTVAVGFAPKLGFPGDAETEKIQISQVGVWHRDDLDIDDDLDWYGVFGADDSLELKRVKLRVEPTFYAIIDTGTQMSGRRVSIDVDKRPVFLVAGINDLREGYIAGKKYDREFLLPGQTVVVSTGDTYSTLGAFGAAIPNEFDRGIWNKARFSDYTLRLSTLIDGSAVRQDIIEKYDFWDYGPGLIWTGDLDRDGNVDLLIDVSVNSYAATWVLYLSSKAGEGQLVREVARFTRISRC